MSNYQVGDAIYDSFGVPVEARAKGNTCDALYEIADGLQAVARAIHALGNGDACTHMGAIEAFGAVFKESVDGLANAIETLKV